ncbi:MFS transporter [Methylobacterium variabile]|uniref:MFS transporter n=1 Tax=Methylobacterium variabile TaxID=298794 RepID=A0A0J6SEK2_9HYPH|nr:MFS transporter [Methylobacterium variabile]KMO32084.1 MFS transporter [Methylobacterium variabile]
MTGTTGVIRLLFAIQLVTMAAMEMSGPFWPLRLKEISASDLAFSVAATGTYLAPMLGIALTGSLWGRLGDRYGHKPMMLRALAGLALTQLGLAVAGDPWTIVLLRFVQGACAGFSAPAQAYGVGLVTPERRGRLFAFLQVSTNVGSLGGAVLGGVILDHAGFFWINAAASGLCVACSFCVVALLPPVSPAPRSPAGVPAPAAAVWRNPVILGLLIAHGCLLASRLLPQMPFSLYVRATFGVENWVIGFCYGLMATGFVASAALWARLFEGRTRQATLGGIALVALACAGVALVAGATHSIAIFAASYCAWGALLGAATPVLTGLISREAAAHRQGHILGVVQSATQASSMAGVALGGLLSQAAGSAAIFPTVAILYLVSCGFLLRLRQAEDRRSPTTWSASP